MRVVRGRKGLGKRLKFFQRKRLGRSHDQHVFARRIDARRLERRLNPQNGRRGKKLAQAVSRSRRCRIAGNHNRFCLVLNHSADNTFRELKNFCLRAASVRIVFRIAKIIKILMRKGLDQMRKDTNATQTRIKHTDICIFWIHSFLTNDRSLCALTST